jgi:hypothetical protein
MPLRLRHVLVVAAMLGSAGGGVLLGHYAWDDDDATSISAAGAGQGPGGLPTPKQPIVDPLPPRGPTIVQAVGATQTAWFGGYPESRAVTKVTWDEAKDNKGVAGYRVYTSGRLAGTVGPSTLELIIGRHSCDTPLPVAVFAFDAAGHRSDGATITITPTRRVTYLEYDPLRGERVGKTSCVV